MMTVKQLIEELQKLPDNIPVKINSTGKRHQTVDLGEVRYEGTHVQLDGD